MYRLFRLPLLTGSKEVARTLAPNRSHTIHTILSGSDDIAEKARQLVQEANTKGGRDNISVVLVRVNQMSTRDAEDEIMLTDHRALVATTRRNSSYLKAKGWLSRLLKRT